MVDSTKQKTFWLINQYASTPETGMGGRHFYLAKELAKQGHTVYLIAASYTHLLRKPPALKDEYKIEDVAGFKFVWVKVPEYGDAHDKKRVLNWFKFAWKLSKLPKVIVDKPDAILFSSPSLIPFLGAQRLARKFNAKLAFEVRDIWPLTLVELGGYSPKHPFIRLMQWMEDKAYRDSDVVLSNLPNAVEHMVQRGMDKAKFSWIPNGFDLDEVSQTQPIAESVINSLPKDKFIVGYAGTLGVANALDTLIEAAEILKDQTDIAFVLVGGGKEKPCLVEKAQSLNNVIFIEPIKKAQIQTMLKQFDVCFIGWRNESIYRFGIAPNKLPEYMMSAKPIVHSYSGSFDFVVKADAGISVPPENPQAVAEAVLKLKAMSTQERTELGQNGRNYAIQNHDYAKLAEKLAKVLSE
ncbi:MAG: glycosyltransferase family 4 protein [Thiomicrospira sp.]|uniref:glycosyltransferase family 4 protein n=1 Tax=Thiomicrospira sp. TaxID=935 RepID=UPI0019FF9304|nr:glycosyltransferase family 4 protein [Thiomicrospira sp.]MBE0494660.1 glycosyltransferase family 4 protein [Thiomicrospira sp.]